MNPNIQNVENRFFNIVTSKVKGMSYVAATLSIGVLTTIFVLLGRTSRTNLLNSVDEQLIPHSVEIDRSLIEIITFDTLMIDLAVALFSAFLFVMTLHLLLLLNKWYWIKVRYKIMDISGEWFVYQTDPNEDTYFRIGKVTIIQEYDKYIMNTKTTNIRYFKNSNTFRPNAENLESSDTTEHGIIGGNGRLEGVYKTHRLTSETALGGLGSTSIDEYDSKKRPSKMSGEFGDAVFDKKKPRNGNKVFFRNENAFRLEATELCQKRCSSSNEYNSKLGQVPNEKSDIGNTQTEPSKNTK